MTLIPYSCSHGLEVGSNVVALGLKVGFVVGLFVVGYGVFIGDNVDVHATEYRVVVVLIGVPET